MTDYSRPLSDMARQLIGGTAWFMLLCLLCLSKTSQSTSFETKPNIVLLFADDVSNSCEEEQKCYCQEEKIESLPEYRRVMVIIVSEYCLACSKTRSTARSTAKSTAKSTARLTTRSSMLAGLHMQVLYYRYSTVLDGRAD